MDRTILDLSRQKIEYADARPDPARATRRRCCSSPSPATTQDELVAALDRLTALWERNGHGYHTLRAVTPAQQGALLKVRKSASAC